MSGVRIVYPDANRHISDLMAGSRLERVQQAGRFTAHIGRPESDQQSLLDISIGNIVHYYRGDPINIVAAPEANSR